MSIYVMPTKPKSNPKFGTTNNLIELDAFITESHTFSNAIQAHPVEKGEAITDDIMHEPMELEIEAVISPYGIGVDDRNNPRRADSAYKKLMVLYASKIPVTVLTGLTTYKSMGITNITIPRNKANSQTLRFTISFKKVRIVGSASVEIDTLGEILDFIEMGKFESGGFVSTVQDHTAVDLNTYSKVEGSLSQINIVAGASLAVGLGTVVGTPDEYMTGFKDDLYNNTSGHKIDPNEGNFEALKGSDPAYAGQATNRGIEKGKGLVNFK